MLGFHIESVLRMHFYRVVDVVVMLDGLFYADVPLRNYSLTHSCTLVVLTFGTFQLLALTLMVWFA